MILYYVHGAGQNMELAKYYSPEKKIITNHPRTFPLRKECLEWKRYLLSSSATFLQVENLKLKIPVLSIDYINSNIINFNSGIHNRDYLFISTSCEVPDGLDLFKGLSESAVWFSIWPEGVWGPTKIAANTRFQVKQNYSNETDFKTDLSDK